MLKALQLKLEEVEAQRKKDAEEVEVERKKDAERVEAQRKKDAERVEAQRKRDQADAKEQNRKLEVEINELKYEIRRLEQHASEGQLERKQKDEGTRRYIESLALDMEVTKEFLAVGDEAGLDRIKRRNLLDRAQALLATYLGLVPDGDHLFASMHFREALGPSNVAKDRQQRLSELLTKKKDEIPTAAALLLAKPAALELLAERSPKVRVDGDQIAHGHRQRSWYEGSVTRSVGTDKVALAILLDLVSPVVGQ